MKRVTTRSSWGVLSLMLVLGGCDCEDRIRRALSDRSAQTRVPMGDMDGGSGLVAPTSSEPTEVEPNDSRAEATRVELGAELRVVHATIQAARDEDWYLIGAGKDELLEIAVEPVDQSLDVSVALMSSDDTPLLYEVAGRGEVELVPWARLQGGQAVAIRVTSKGGQGAYQLKFRRHLSAGALEAEPDEIWSDAVVVRGAVELQGFYDRPGDRDRFMLEGRGEDVRRVEVSGLADVGQRVTLFRGDQEVWGREVEAGQGVVIPNLGGAPWGLELTGVAGRYSRDVPYRLKVTHHAAVKGALLEREPNDVAGDVLSYGVLGGEPVVVRGYVSDSVDRDVLRFDRPTGEVVRVKLRALKAGQRVWMQLEEGGGQVWAQGEQGDERCMSLDDPAVTMVDVIVGGELEEGGRALEYELDVWGEEKGERKEGEEQEPNDEMRLATRRAQPGTMWEGRLLREGDRDWYAFEVSDEERLMRVGVEAHVLDLMLSIRDEEGGVVANVQGAGAGGEEALEVSLPRGQYFVEVSAKQGSSCEEYRLYVLEK